jgi:hypothetical protein
MGAVRGGFMGLEFDMQAGVALAREFGVPADGALVMLREFDAGLRAGLKKRKGG